jgi:cytochrome c1
MLAALYYSDVQQGAMSPRVILLATLWMIVSCILTACIGGQQTTGYRVRMSGSPDRGKELIQSYGCGSCHLIPGIHTARGMVGPPLLYFSRRTMIAGELPNSPDNLVRWIRNPQMVEPRTAMPALGLSDYDAHDVAAYLYTLR